MLRRWIIAALAIVAALVTAVFLFAYIAFTPRMSDHVNEQFTTDNGKFKIRVTAHAESGGGFVAGAYYVFESAPVRSERWTRIATFRHDDPVPVPRQQVRFVGDAIGYVFMGWIYAVTTDAGRTWSVWQADRDLPRWQCCNYRLLADVVLHEDGSGTMTLHTIPERSGEVPQLETTDYGVSWRATAPNQAMQLTASKLAIYASGICHRTSCLRATRSGLAAADLVSR